MFFVIGFVFEAVRLAIRIAGKLAGALFGLALFIASIAITANAVVFFIRLLPAAVLFMIALSLLTFA